MERVITGIPGFDTLIEGGLPKGSTTLLTGLPGTGKSIFGLQYICNGAKKGENGIYVYAESSADVLRMQAKQIGLDVDELENSGKIALLSVPLNKKDFDMLSSLSEAKAKINAQRVVFDNLATFAINLNLFTIPMEYAGNMAYEVSKFDTVGQQGTPSAQKEEASVAETVVYRGNPEKRIIYVILDALRNLGTTNLVITFSGSAGKKITVDGVSEFVSDGIVRFYNELIGSRRIRTMTVFKMRNTDHSQFIHDFEIGKGGIKVKPAQKVYE